MPLLTGPRRLLKDTLSALCQQIIRCRRIVRDRPMTILLTIVLWAFLLLVICAVLRLGWRMSLLLNSPDKIAIGQFLDNGKPKPDHATEFHDRWLSLSIPGAELKDVGTDLPFSSGGDFLFAEIDQRTGNELADSFAEFAKDIDLKIAGISVQGFWKLLNLMQRPPLTTVEGRVSQCGSETILSVALRYRGKVEKCWSFAKTTGPGEQLPLIIEDLMDDAICQVAVYLQTRNRTDANHGVTSMNNISGLSPKAIASLTKGRRSLNRFMRDNRQTDLAEAQQHFRSLIARSPEYVDGYMMLAYSLAENRQEREAVEIYDRAIRLLKKPDVQEERRLYQAQFLRGSSLLRCYRWKDAVSAIKEFRSLATRLGDLTRKGKPSDDQKEELDAWHYNHYLCAMCYAEIGHCFGHLLVFLPKDRPLDENTRTDLRKLIEEWKSKTPSLPPQGQDGYKDRFNIAEQLYRQSKRYQDLSNRVSPIYEKKWRAGVKARLSEVSGYARYRFAEWRKDLDRAGFQRECSEAIRSLRDAELHKPRNYALLQNIGMILLSRRYDPDGGNLAEAEDYCKRSVEIKPSDYYGYELLSRVNLRRMIGATTQNARDAAAESAEEYVGKALAINPQSRGSGRLQLYIEFTKLYFQPAELNPEDISRLHARLSQYDPRGEDVVAHWIRLCCEWLRLVRTESKAEFDKKKADLIEQLSRYEEELRRDADLTWRMNQVLVSVNTLRSELATVDYEASRNLRLMVEAALD